MTTKPDPTRPEDATTRSALRRDNLQMLGKLAVVVALMSGFGYALVPIYNSICTALGINVLSLAELDVQGGKRASRNTQVDTSRTITIEFDSNAHSLPWRFRPLVRHIEVHPGELTTVEYEVVN